MTILGITGGIGSGKTTVTNIFSLLAIPVYIADIESKKITANSPVIREKLTALLGEELYAENELNKALLASHIFNNAETLKQVNAIIHPEVQKDFSNWIELNKDKQILAIETAILFESGFDHFVDKSITVYTPLEERIKRAMKRDNSDRQEVMNRINSQMPDEEKIKLSDFTIVNDNKHSLIEQTLSLLYNFNYSSK